MEHLKTKVELNGSKAKTQSFDGFKVLNFTPMFEYWLGSFYIIPEALQNLPHEEYKNNKCLTWYETQVLNHDKVMNEFKRIFGWQKK
tara:strand:- start:274 stop:534 length:261 start_codon:yes stop_codon:yes gene_type:complete